MRMSPRVRKFVLSVHLACSVGWIGAAVAYVALGVAAATSHDVLTVRGAWIALEVTGWWAIVPLAIAALLTGVVISLGTSWGLFRHYWVMFSFVLTVAATLVLLLHMPSVSSLAARVRQTDYLVGLGGDLFHPAVGLLVLFTILGLNVYKPRGLTPYGWRRQQQERREQPGLVRQS
jgi:hypothetical protein